MDATLPPPTHTADFFFHDYNFFVCARTVVPRMIAVALQMHRHFAAGSRTHGALVRLSE